MPDRVSIEAGGEQAARDALDRCVSGGGVAVFPADGLYGLCCDPMRAASIGRIHEIKGRDGGKPSAVMYFSALVMRELLTGLGPRTVAALGGLLPGPVTLVIDNGEGHYPLACGSDPARLGVRLIDGPLAGLPMPLFQTSANASGGEAPADVQSVDPAVAGQVDLVIDGGVLTGEPSTVVDIARIDHGGGWKILRHGGLPAGEVERVLGPAA